jgi:hypothetical protein
MEQLGEEKFPKLVAYLNGPANRRVRTNNHVERTNRMFQLLEKVRYKWRRQRSLVRFAVLRLNEIWSKPAKANETSAPRAVKQRGSRPDAERRSCRAA